MGCATPIGKKKIVVVKKGSNPAMGYGYGEVYAGSKKPTAVILAARKKAAKKILSA